MNPDNDQLILIDMQERVAPSMHDLERTLDTVRILLLAARECGVDVTVNEHCPDKLGATLPELGQIIHDAKRVEKQSFGVLGCPQALSHITEVSEQQDRGHVVLAGIEAHVCVMHTAFELLERGFQVTVVADAVASRRSCDYQWALAEFARRGVAVLPMETLVFGWMGIVKHPAFKSLQPEIRDRLL